MKKFGAVHVTKSQLCWSWRSVRSLHCVFVCCAGSNRLRCGGAVHDRQSGRTSTSSFQVLVSDAFCTRPCTARSSLSIDEVQRRHRSVERAPRVFRGVGVAAPTAPGCCRLLPQRAVHDPPVGGDRACPGRHPPAGTDRTPVGDRRRRLCGGGGVQSHSDDGRARGPATYDGSTESLRRQGCRGTGRSRLAPCCDLSRSESVLPVLRRRRRLIGC